MKQTFKIHILSLLFLFLAMHTKAQDCKTLWQQAINETNEMSKIAYFRMYIDNFCKDSLAEAHFYVTEALIQNGQDILAESNLDKVIALKPNWAKAWFVKGWLNQKDAVIAIKYYSRAIKIDPKFARAYNNRGSVKHNLKDYAGAIQDYNVAIELDPTSANAYNNRGNAKANLKDYRGAIQDCDKAIELDPTSANAYINRGSIKENLKDYKGALQDYDKGIELDPNLAISYNNRGLVKHYLKDYKGAIQDCDKAIKLDPKLVNAYNNRGLAKNSLEDYKGAIQDYDKTIELDPMFATAYTNRGASKYELKDYKASIKDHDKAIELDPTSANAYNSRGFVKHNLEDYNGARQDYDKAIELDPKYVNAYDNRGCVKAYLKDYKGAIEDHNKAIELDPNSEIVYNNRGLTKRNLKDYNGAIQDHDKAIELDPNYTNAFHCRGYTKFYLKDYKGAIQDYNKALKLAPNEIPLYYSLSEAFYKLTNYNEALININKFLQASPNGLEGYLLRGKIYITQKKYTEALNDFAEALKIDANNVATYEARGYAYFLIGRYQDAIKDHETMQQKAKDDFEPEFDYVNEAKRLLQTQNITRPSVTFGSQLPTKVTTEIITISGCGKGKELTEIVAFVNGKKYSTPRDFIISASNCDYALNTKVLLREGTNEIYFSVTNSAGTATSEKRTVIHESPKRLDQTAPKEKRLALIIGNGNYDNNQVLKNAKNDADSMARVLRQLGFTVILKTDATKATIRDAVKEFRDKLEKQSYETACFFYSGHGVENDGKNYIIPTDQEKSARRADIEDGAINLNWIISSVNESGVKHSIFFLDCCRTASRGVGSGGGFAAPVGYQDMLIAFSTAKDSPADDGDGTNSPYTTALLEHIRTPQLDISLMLKKVRKTVLEIKKGEQIPAEYNTMVDEFYFKQ
jgi:tetratricopeptide (TPR) repeat protein